MAKIKERERVIEELKSLPEEILESLFNYAQYLKDQKMKVKIFESEYGSFNKLREKIQKEKHSWEEEKDLFEWEAILTEEEKIKRILIKSKN